MNFDKQFHGKVKLDSNKKNQLLSSKGALREKIKKDFKAKGRLPVPNFYMQGSFSMTTTINPISVEYDLDDGVYLQNIDTSKPIDEWESPEKVHKWIVDAVDGHTSKDPTDKNLCVRVNYADENKHVDLPIYAKKGDTYYLAVKNNGWIESNPKEVSDWFVHEVATKGEQYRRVVRYLKAWKDFREDENKQVKLYGGFQLTVLASYHFVPSDSDEESFFKTIESIKTQLWIYKSKICHPKNGSKNIIEHYTEARRKKFVEEFEKMYDEAKSAYEETDCVEKSKKWRIVFGNRFPLLKNDDCGEVKNDSEAAIITGTTNIANTSGRQA